jgi:6-phosphogluconolactonase/glucosamine-6-phosphate isomerase/deaminase
VCVGRQHASSHVQAPGEAAQGGQGLVQACGAIISTVLRESQHNYFVFDDTQITFNMDEYVALPQDHAESYHTFMHENLFRHIDILPENAHILDGNAADLTKECDDYEAKIAAVGGIELFLAG